MLLLIQERKLLKIRKLLQKLSIWFFRKTFKLKNNKKDQQEKGEEING